MLLEAFSQSILKWLRIPPGSSVRKANEPSTSSAAFENEYVDAILDITVDDICVGEEPLSIVYDDKSSSVAKLKLDDITKEFNSIVKDVCRDLLENGYAVYDAEVGKNNKLVLLPVLDQVEFYLTKSKQVVAYAIEDGKQEKENLSGKVIFINYNKRDLEKVEDCKYLDIPDAEDIRYKINPRPMQLANAHKTIQGLNNCEDSIAKYRALLRPVRWANVDIGTAVGDQQTEVVDSISQGINANSTSLSNGAAYSEFDDNIPIMPNRKGIGKPEIASDIPSADISDLADLEYWLKKLALITRFPSSYLDFTKVLGETAVSMLRGDLRYQKLCKAVGTLIVTTINDFIQSSKFAKYKPVVSLTTIPTSEDDDVIDAMDKYVDLVEKIDNYICGEGDTIDPDAALHRLELLQTLFSTSTNSPVITKWFSDYREYIEQFKAAETPEGEEGLGEEGLGDLGDMGDFGSEGGYPDEGSLDSGSEGGMEDLSEEGGAEDIEILQPQS